jgi:hypothetical protein
MIIIFNIMWLWGFADLMKLLNKASRVTKEAKKFNDSDQFYFLVYDSFFLYALEEYSAQRVQLGLPDSWAGFQSFLHRRKGKTDQVRTQWVEFFCSYGWWYVAAHGSPSRRRSAAISGFFTSVCLVWALSV